MNFSRAGNGRAGRLGARLALWSVCSGALGLAPTAALADDWTIGGAHPTVIETTYVPNMVTFQIDQSPSASCPAGHWLTWYAKGADQPSKIANIQSVMSVLMTAKTSGKAVWLSGVNADCSVNFMWFTD